MTIDEARELLKSPLWKKLRDHVRETGSFAVYPAGDERRLEYLDEPVRKAIAVWREAVTHLAEWRTVVDGKRVRELEAQFPGAYPEALRYAVYFADASDAEANLRKVLKLRFPEAYELVYNE